MFVLEILELGAADCGAHPAPGAEQVPPDSTQSIGRETQLLNINLKAKSDMRMRIKILWALSNFLLWVKTSVFGPH